MIIPWFALSYIFLWLLSVTTFLAVLFLYREEGMRYINRTAAGRAMQGPAIGSMLTVRSLVDVAGLQVTVGPSFGKGKLLFFGSPRCLPCTAVLPVFASIVADHRQEIDGVIVCKSDRDAAERWRSDAGAGTAVVADPGGQIQALYKVHNTPFVIAIDASGVVRARGIVSARRANLETFVTAAASIPSQVPS
jgi:hypothetical protein